MSFDRTKPVNGTTVDADLLRGNMNDLDDRDGTTNGRIDQTNAEVTATNARIDAIPPAFPWNSDAEINGNLKVNGSQFVQGELALFESDGGGSGETGVRIGRATAGGVQLPLITLRTSGSTIFAITLDLGGHGDGMGTPTIADGALWRWDQTSTSMKPWNVIIRTIQAQDENGDPVTLQVICPPA